MLHYTRLFLALFSSANSTSLQIKRWRAVKLCVAALWAVMVCLMMWQPARAQQWSGPDASNNISNTNSGNVGIGTAAPNFKLDVNGAAGINGNFTLGNISVGNGLFGYDTNYGGTLMFSITRDNPSNTKLATYLDFLLQTNGSERMRVTSAGNVGIGTSAPSQKLTVSGGNIGLDNNNWMGFKDTNGGYNGLFQYSYLNNLQLMNGNATGNIQLLSNNNSGSIQFLTSTNYTERMRITAGGNVGIGTTAPSAGLAVNRTGSIGNANQSAYDIGAGRIAAGSNFYSYGSFCAGNQYEDCTSTGGVTISATTPVGSPAVSINGGGNSYFNSGNVGIGNSSPAYKLDVNGSINATGFYVNGAPLQTGGGGSSQWTTNGSSIFYNSGNVGIGATSPGQKLDVNGTARVGTMTNDSSMTRSNSVTNTLWIARSSANDANSFIGSGYEHKAIIASGETGQYSTEMNRGGLVMFRSQYTSTGETNSIYRYTGPGSNVEFYFRRPGSTDATPYTSPTKFWDDTTSLPAYSLMKPELGLILNSAGNVGIGTAAPTAKLHIVGDITVTGNINAKYQDVAEWVPARHQMSIGTVVVLDSVQSNQVLASTHAYDTKVAGVITGRPGIVLGEGGSGKVMVATTGRVKVKVDASRAPIHLGDLLVTSNEEGIAMKSEPLSLGGVPIHRPGTLIGKALEPLASGTGEILVLLSLQ